MSDRCWTLGPADIAFLWEECPRCLYLKVVSGLPRPRAGVPRLYAVAAAGLHAAFRDRRTETISPALPKGVVEHQARAIVSAPLTVHLPDRAVTCAIRGTLDTLLRFEDGSYGVVGFAAGGEDAERMRRHARALHAYALALENPAGGAAPERVSRLGLLELAVGADAAGASADTPAARGDWVEVPRDDQAFFGLLAEVLAVLERPAPPGGRPLCHWCVYRDASRRTGL